MDPKEFQELMNELKMMREALDDISNSLAKFVDEGITIYMHENGPEAKN